MRKGYYEDITTFLVKHTFHRRFFLSRLTKKSKIAKKIITKLFFEGDEIFILPNKNTINKTKNTDLNTQIKTQTTNKTKNTDLNTQIKAQSSAITTNIEVNQSFQKDDSEFVPSEILKKVIKEAKDIVIMNKCLCRSSANCQDYPQELGCIFLGPASRKIASRYGRRASAEEALKHVDWADAEGLSHVIGRNKIDTVWMNVSPKEELLTICHCCPCCCLWKVVPDLDNDISDKVMRLEGVEVHTNMDKCKMCKKCLDDDVCFGGAISLENGKISINQKKCLGCGHCVQICEFDVFELSYTQKSLDSIINRIGELVDYKK
ncbi:indolepyruvate ferredoxin oxidoreductase subunit alpha [Methanobrevibacter olleyae]|uniref:4Fe-4S binding domain-containing protein n=1 Tax=Methanobrevibacter olleyae TaxID=294671 RepID=A0A126QYH4_METOL|nr:4Fe-4S binding protein [Methanobrevibacter olleyae]AMK14852.1 4Fe-4S ferredoxin iron-sulfur binding domain-containing protein [Methanobrevibacter olleyae]SFL34643.1 4Fe-4S binding domain-containing protein [Methanobrevibacter olleyae]